ncbi:26531_t:CDS:2, partial [Racocetra persica]
NDPFISEDWVAGQNFVIGAQEDIRAGLYKLLSRLLDRFEKQDGKMHHDVEFQIQHENGIEKIKSSRYVLSAAKYQKITVDIDDIDPSAFHVLIHWLYRQELEEAISA